MLTYQAELGKEIESFQSIFQRAKNILEMSPKHVWGLGLLHVHAPIYIVCDKGPK